MTGDRLALLRKALLILSVAQGEHGIRLSELARRTGVSAEEIVSELPRLVNLIGVPPYSPMDLVDLEIKGDRVTLRFARQFRRPVLLTLSEAFALTMALAGWEREEGPFVKAVRGIREKVRGALDPEVARRIEGASPAISAVAGPGQAPALVALLLKALSRQVATRISYFSRSSGGLAERIFEPWGVYEQEGHFYFVGPCLPPGRVVTLRADRIREARLTKDEYVIPDDFEVAQFRREGPPDPEEPTLCARIRFEPEIARFARELFPGSDLEEDPDGALRMTVRTTGRFWLVAELLRWGAQASVLEPPDLRAELLARARETLTQYEPEAG